MAHMTDLTWSSAELQVTSSSGTFNLSVSGSDLDATNGTFSDSDSNKISGTLTVASTSHTIPSDGAGLDPEFDQAGFDASWQCAADLTLPVSHACTFVAPLAIGSAQLSARTLGTVLRLVNADTTCGFSSVGVATGVAFNAESTVGADAATATFTIADATPCTLTFGDTPVTLSADCNGVTASVSGAVTVSGTKTVTGYRTGNVASPVVPTSRDAVAFNLALSFENFNIEKSDSTNSLKFVSGQLVGIARPRTALDVTTGACSISTPALTFENITHTNSAVQLVSDGKRFDMTLNTSDLDAQNGTKDSTSNTLAGSMTVDGTAISIPADMVLDPAFLQATFDASFACTPHIFIPSVDAACNFKTALGTGAARLLMKSLGTATSIIDKDTTCGYASPSAGGTAQASCAPACDGTLTLTASACGVTLPPDTSLGVTDCIGTTTTVGGTVSLSGTKVITGHLTGSQTSPIVPGSRTAAVLDHTYTFTSFHAYSLAAGQTTPTGKLTFSATLDAELHPVATDSQSAPGIYAVSTPIASFAAVTVTTGGEATLVSSGSTFVFSLDAASLTALSGSYEGDSNDLEGSITIDGFPVTIAAGTPLDPAFDQTAFESTYTCAGNAVPVE
jgi:hypothetical protein